MGLFENLFKSRSEGSVERGVEVPVKAAGQGQANVAGETELDPATAFLQPKGYAPGTTSPTIGGQNQGLVPVLPGSKKAPERKAHSVDQAAVETDEVVLTIGDVLPRIPVGLLASGPRDLKRELRFHIDHLSSDITRGRPAIALSLIAEQCPDIFSIPIGDDEDMEIRLPLQKLVEQVGRIRSRAPSAPPPAHAHRAPVAPIPERPVVAEPAAPVPAPSPRVMAEPMLVTEPEAVVERAAESETSDPIVEAAPSEVESAAGRKEMAAADSVIDLGLAAILAKLPREMFAEGLPPVGESDRITLPFPMIERQLGTGTVEISGKLFWSALPPLLKHHFVLREDLAVPLPLEEIFQNLPVGGESVKPRFDPLGAASPRPSPVEVPIVLAPVPHEETPELDLEPASAVAEAGPLPAVAVPDEDVASPALAPQAVTLPPAEIPAPPEALPESPAVTSLPSPPDAAPDVDPDAAVQLQPFRVFSPLAPAVDAGPEAEMPIAEPIVLGNAPLSAPAPEEAPQILRALEPGEIAEAGSGSSDVDPADEPAARSDLHVLARPEEARPPFEVLPSPPRERVVLPPDPEPLVAFTPDQPPPLRIETPAAAVAVLRGTVPAPAELPVAALATTTVQPPQMFRPTVLPPRIFSQGASPVANLAPTLAGHTPAASGMITLAAALGGQGEPAPLPPSTSIAAESAPASEPLPAVPPAAEFPAPNRTPEPALSKEASPPESRETERKRKNSPRRPVPAAEEPATPPSPEPNPSPAIPPALLAPSDESQPALRSLATSPDGSPFHLPLPAVPPPPTAAAASGERTPPALPISRFDQHSLQSLFMTEETLDLPKVSRLAAALPGIQGCIIATRGESFTGGTLPKGFRLSDLRGLSPQVGAAADRLPIGVLKNFTLYGDEFSISFFERPSISLCAIHRVHSFVPGVRERLVAVVDELARGEGEK